MSRAQWTLYLSGVAAECVADRHQARLLVRAGRVNPCAECALGFRMAAAERSVCHPDFFVKTTS